MDEKIVVIDFDDSCPKEGFGGELDKGPLQFVKKLNTGFGAKVTLFVPLNMEDKYPLHKFPEYVNYLKRLHSFGHEIAAHGIIHTTNNPQLGAMEFLPYDRQNTDLALQHIKKAWNSLGFDVKGMRYPGWGETRWTEELSSKYFDYVASHILGEFPVIGYNKLYKMPYNLSIENLYDIGQRIYLIHGHIGTDANTKNILNLQTYQNIVKFLVELEKKYKIRYMTYSDLLTHIKQHKVN